MAELPKLYYFNFTGRAEGSRLAALIGGIEFEDIRLKGPEWMEMKPKTVSGKMPFLVLPDGTNIFHSSAITHYWGTLGGLIPEDPVAAAKMNAIFGWVTDVADMFADTMRLPEEEKKEKREKLASETLPPIFAKLESYITETGTTGFAVGDKITLADIQMTANFGHFTETLGPIDYVPGTILDPYPRIKSCMQSLLDHPAVKKHYEEYPKGLKPAP